MFRSRSRCDAVPAVLLVFLIYSTIVSVCLANESTVQEFLDELTDETFDTDVGFDTAALEALLREAAAFRENPVDVNSASLPVLLRVPDLAPASAARIVAGRSEHGPARTLYALVARGILSAEELERVRPYVTVLTPVPARRPPPPLITGHQSPARKQPTIAWEFRSRAITQERWEPSWDERGAWNGLGTYARLRVSHTDRLNLSVTCERDVGEREFADHLVGSLVWRNGAPSPGDGPVVKLGLGDFSGCWGQGLMLRSGGFPSADAYPRRRDLLRAYEGAGESVSRRGAFVVASRGAVTVASLVARTQLDAATDDSGLVTSVRTSGHHRTAGEREGTAVLSESVAGVRVQVESGHWRLSGSTLRFGYAPELTVSDPVRKRFAFCGEKVTLGGIDARYESGRVTGALEVASMSEGGAAVLGAIVLNGESWRFKGGAGHLARDYWSPLGGGIPGFSGGSNGAAAWLRTEYRSDDGWRVWTTTRVAERPWRSYNSELPDAATSFAVGGELRGTRGWRLSAESGASSRTGSEGDPPLTVENIVRRDRVTLRAGSDVPLSVTVRRAVPLGGGADEKPVMALSLRLDGDIGDLGDYIVGVTTVSTQGAPPRLAHYEPRLPGEFGLRSLNATGARWYARVRAALPSGLGLSVRAGGGPERGMTEFGVGLDARG